ncbi:hypothetical protein DPMN_135467 [Dreissena polymorpha]|uniref:Uncharacterized protein n=1 Tax=Dreissena polymorpha TaxID=45954 RepID=A0A9D4G108_DREPO|nr:hypothetical protein DPMN_135467 [Dreissena polymorpha]
MAWHYQPEFLLPPGEFIINQSFYCHLVSSLSTRVSTDLVSSLSTRDSSATL